MAEIFIRCASIGCRRVLTVAAETRGMLVTCPHCKQVLRIPQPRAAGAAPAGVVGAGAAGMPRRE
jgi:phage FluMu protein Com